MSQSKKRSLAQKLIFSVIPTLVIAAAVSVYIYQNATQVDADGARAMSMTEYVSKQELEMVKMSEALRGYLLNPSNKEEYERKKAADEKYSEYSEKLGALLTDAPEALALNKEMAKYDETTLDEIENQVAKLIEEKSKDAVTYYTKNYMDARTLQNQNFGKLKTLVAKRASEILDGMQAKKVKTAILTIILLLGSVVFGIGLILAIVFSTVGKSLKLFEEVYAIADKLTNASAKLGESSTELSEAVTEQAAAIQETAASLDEMTAMIQKNSENAMQSRKTSESSRHSADQGKTAMSEMNEAMIQISQSNQTIMTQVESGNREISGIIELMNEISNKTKVINDIVFQTKLLSFNASVEAARAGEHGKGFAVVAEEVGNLAQMSGNAAKEISQKLDDSNQRVNEIIENTKRQVESLIQDGKKKVERGSQIAEGCTAIFSGLAQSVGQVDHMVTEISTASDEQTKGIQEINKAISQFDQTTQQNSVIAKDSNDHAITLSDEARRLREQIDALGVLFKGSSH
jgi:methyl-accepting chemotaxis protein